MISYSRLLDEGIDLRRIAFVVTAVFALGSLHAETVVTYGAAVQLDDHFYLDGAATTGKSAIAAGGTWGYWYYLPGGLGFFGDLQSVFVPLSLAYGGQQAATLAFGDIIVGDVTAGAVYRIGVINDIRVSVGGGVRFAMIFASPFDLSIPGIPFSTISPIGVGAVASLDYQLVEAFAIFAKINVGYDLFNLGLLPDMSLPGDPQYASSGYSLSASVGVAWTAPDQDQ